MSDSIRPTSPPPRAHDDAARDATASDATARDATASDATARDATAGDVLAAADTMGPAELDRLPYGMIQLDRSGRILNYNAVESKLAALRKEDAIGKQFFTEIAPCTKVQEFYGRFREGVIRESLDTSFRFHFAFRQSPRDVTVRLLYSRRTRTVWVLISDHEGKPLESGS